MCHYNTMKIAIMKKSFLYLAFALAGSSPLVAQNKPISKAAAIVQKMTLEEKARLVVGMGMKIPGLTEGGAVGATEDKVSGAAGTTFALPTLGVPSVVVADGPAGLRINPTRADQPNATFYCTAFPVGSLLASTWDTALVKKVGVAMGNEVKEYGVDVLLGPALNNQRNPLGGRNFEYYSEDPLVSGYITAAMVNGIQSNGVGTSIKHFAANNQETNRMMVNTVASERTLREIYLRSFEIAIKQSQPWTVMSSYNRINGVYASESNELLTTILRKEWGFKGIVMTDWFGGSNPAEQMKAGNDLLMPGTPKQMNAILDAVKNGSLSEEVLNTNAARLIELALRSPSFQKYAFSNKPNLEAHAQVARQAAADGMVLLKNENNTLPLGAVKKVAAFGNTSYNFISGGTGSGDVNEAYTISLVDGLTKAGYSIDEQLKPTYEKYIAEEKAKQPKPKFFFELVPPVAEMDMPEAQIQEAANSNDIAIFTLGRNAGEFQDRKMENDYLLSATELQMIKKIAAAFHDKGKKLLVIINSGGTIETVNWRKDADAILLAWQPGQESGNAVADVLSGKVNPSGKLAVSFPLEYNDLPSSKNFPGKELSDKMEFGNFGMPIGKKSEVRYEEGLYVGYRYYNSAQVAPAFAFGFGLSYTQFKYSNLKLSSPQFGNNIIATVTITNTGKTAGREVVQLYLSAPQKFLSKPNEELKGFAKTQLLQPGQSQTIRFTLDANSLASYEEKRSSWVAEAGNYTVKIGAASNNILQTASFTLAKEKIAAVCNKSLTLQEDLTETSRP